MQCPRLSWCAVSCWVSRARVSETVGLLLVKLAGSQRCAGAATGCCEPGASAEAGVCVR